jgi:hypothetical protein
VPVAKHPDLLPILLGIRSRDGPGFDNIVGSAPRQVVASAGVKAGYCKRDRNNSNRRSPTAISFSSSNLSSAASILSHGSRNWTTVSPELRRWGRKPSKPATQGNVSQFWTISETRLSVGPKTVMGQHRSPCGRPGSRPRSTDILASDRFAPSSRSLDACPKRMHHAPTRTRFRNVARVCAAVTPASNYGYAAVVYAFFWPDSFRELAWVHCACVLFCCYMVEVRRLLPHPLGSHKLRNQSRLFFVTIRSKRSYCLHVPDDNRAQWGCWTRSIFPVSARDINASARADN